MNAEEIFRKYVRPPEPEPVSLRRTGRTTRALKSLSPGSVYVVPYLSMIHNIDRMAMGLMMSDLHIMSIDIYNNNYFYKGRRALNGEMVAFDHTIYESEFDKLEYDKVLDVTFRYRLAEYDIYFDQRLCNIRPEE